VAEKTEKKTGSMIKIAAFAVVAMAAIGVRTSALAATLPPHLEEAITNAAAVTEAKTYTNAAGASLNYRFHAPVRVETGKRYPLILFLHGSGSRGSDNTRHLVHGRPIISYMIEKKKECFFLAPQCPVKQRWWGFEKGKLTAEPSAQMALVLELLDKTIKERPVDTSRMYVTGLSMGGYGTWDIILRRPDLFAAAMPICGGGDTTLAWKVRSVPIWVFHGSADRAVPVFRSRSMVSALWAAGYNAHYREYPDAGHNVWTRTYRDDEVLKWFFSQRNKRLDPPQKENGRQ
jgi:predicted peptidase